MRTWKEVHLSMLFKSLAFNKECCIMYIAFKYIHYDLTYACGSRIVTLMVSSNFVTTFSPKLNVGSFICIWNFWIIFKNKFEYKDLSFGLEGQGKHHNRLNWSIFYHIIVCFGTFHTWIYAKIRLRRIGHSRICGHQYLW